MRQLLIVLVLICSSQAYAAIDSYSFANEADAQRYAQMIDDLRCPKCQNQNLSGSNSPIAKDLRDQVQRLIHEGESNAAIKEYMVQRYGNFVLYEPPVDRYTYLLWGAPLLLLLLAGLFTFFFKRKQTQGDRKALLNPTEQEELQRILRKY